MTLTKTPPVAGVNFTLDEDHKMVQEMVRKLGFEEIAPKAAEYDRTREFPWDNIK